MKKENNILDKFSKEDITHNVTAEEIKENNLEDKLKPGEEIKIPTKEETVTVKKETFDELMKRLERVEFAASKSHLANYDEKNKGELGKTVKLRVMDGKVVVSWDNMLKNSVEKTPTGVWHEEQIVNLHFEDNTSMEIELVYFNRRFTHLIADVISETKTNDGNLIYKVKTADGRSYEIDGRFIN
jgi:hypothetical protein